MVLEWVVRLSPGWPWHTPGADCRALQVEGGCHRPQEAAPPDAGLPCRALLCGRQQPARRPGPQRGVSHCRGEPGQGPPGPGPRGETGHLLHQVSEAGRGVGSHGPPSLRPGCGPRCLLSFTRSLPSGHAGAWPSHFTRGSICPGPPGLRTHRIHSHWRRRGSSWPRSRAPLRLLLLLPPPPRQPVFRGSVLACPAPKPAASPLPGSLRAPRWRGTPPLLPAAPGVSSSQSPAQAPV